MIHYARNMPESLKEALSLDYSAYVYPLIRIVGMGVVALITLRLIDSALARVRLILPPGELLRDPRVEQRALTLGRIVRSVAKAVLWLFVGLTAARELGYDITPVLTSVGIVGVAVGFGAQSVVKDLLSGFFILLEDQYGVGDIVRIGTLSGEVEQMTLRATTLRNQEGHVHVIPNGSIQTVTVLTKEWSRALVDVTVDYKENIDRVISVLEQTGAELRKDWPDRVLERPEILGVENMTPDGVTVRCLAKTPPSRQWEVAREWRRRIKDEFDRQGIEIPTGEQSTSVPTQRPRS